MRDMFDDEVVRGPAAEGVQRSVIRTTVLVALAFLLGVPAAYVAVTRMPDSYTAEGELWIEVGARGHGSQATPAEPASDAQASAWIGLLRSREVLGSLDLDGSEVARGRGADPDERDAVRALQERLLVSTARGGGVVRVSLSGTDPRETARVVNAVMDRTVEVAAHLKRSRLDEAVALLAEQLQGARADLEQAERAMETFRVERLTTSGEPPSALAEAQTGESRLRREIQLSEALYADLRGRLEAARSTAASATPDLRVLRQASVPDHPSRRHRLPVVLVVLLASLGLVVGGGLLLERRNVARSPRS